MVLSPYEAFWYIRLYLGASGAVGGPIFFFFFFFGGGGACSLFVGVGLLVFYGVM